MKNLVFYGDGLLCPPEGYGEGVVDLLVTRRPGAAFKSFHMGEESLTVDAALRGAPALIGKAPDTVVVGLGTADLLQGASLSAMLEPLGALVQVLLLKTQARVALVTVCSAFMPEASRAPAAAFNASLQDLAGMAGERVTVLNVDDVVNTFLEAHRRGPGEKRALHSTALRLTATGRALLSHSVYRFLRLDEAFPE